MKVALCLHPPCGNTLVLGACIAVRRVTGKTELHVITRQLAFDVFEIGNQIDLFISVGVPGAIDFFSVRVGMRNNPPLIIFQNRRALGKMGEIGHQMSQ